MGVHDRFVRLAERLIAKHGAPVVLRKMSRTPTDPDKPWRGNQEEIEAEITVRGVVTDYEAEEIDHEQVRIGEHIKATDRRLLIAAGPVDSHDLTTFDLAVVDDGAEVYSIIAVSVVKPGTTRILYDVQIRQ